MRKLMWFSIGFACACFLGAYVAGAWLVWLAAAAAVLTVAALICRRWMRCLRIPAALCLGLFLGLLWFFRFDAKTLSIPKGVDGQTQTLVMTAVDYSYATDYGYAADMECFLEGKRYTVRVYFDDAVELSPGDVILGAFRLRATAGGAQEPSYLRGNGICLIAYQRANLTVVKAQSVPLRFYPAVLRQKLLQQIDRLFPEDTAGFAKALILGDRSDIDYETDTAFRLSGISHIIAVSGLHVSILFGLVFLLTGRNRYLAGLFGIPVLLFFAAMVGFTPSITRACIMECLMLVAMLVSREYDPPTALGFAALCILTANPLSVVSVSFQLSFGCMIGIYLFSGKIYNYLVERMGAAEGKKLAARVKRWFATSVSITLGTGVVTSPLVACYFGAVSLVGAVTNLLTIWLITYIFYGILFVCAAGTLSIAMGTGLAWLVSILIRLVTGIAKFLGGLPLAAVYTQSVYIVLWLILCYVLLAAYLIMKKKPALTFSCCIVFGLCVALLASWAEPLLDDCRVTVLDVGQGQAILLQSEGRTYLVDCGGDYAEDAADKTADYLLSHGVSRLDGIIATHYDEDHVGGIPYLLTRMEADAVFLPVSADDTLIADAITAAADDRVVWAMQDMKLTFGDACIQLFVAETGNSDNERSICVLFQAGNCDILITGDRSKTGELELTQKHNIPELEVLIAGHHGSKNSTSDALLTLTSPEYVFISVGENNWYGHPAEETLERLEKHGCIVYRTDEQGTIIFRG